MNRQTTVLRYIIFALSFFTCYTAFAQTDYTIKGTVNDKSSKEAVAAARVYVLDIKNSSLISRVQTAADGHFEIKFKKGQYSISIAKEGYETLQVPVNYAAFKNNVYAMPPVQLKPKTTALAEVTVMAKDFRMENERGKRVIYIGNKLRDAAGSMANLLSYMPSVHVDIDGKVQLRGREPIIMINGRKSNLSKSDALQMLPSEMVKKVEIISNPTAREGETEPIINIITDKKGRGLIGGINLSAGLPTTLKGGLHLALNKEKFNGYGLYGIKREDGIKNYTSELLEKESEGYTEKENSSNRTEGTNHFGELQYEYVPDKQTELTGSTALYAGNNKALYAGRRRIEERGLLITDIGQRSNNAVNSFSAVNELEFQKKFNDEKNLFKAELEYEYEQREKTEHFTEQRIGNAGEYASDSYDKYHGNVLKLKTRYDMTLKNEAYLTLGYRLDGSVINQDQQFYANNIASPLYNDIRYSQYSHSAFADYSNYFKGVYYNIGLSLKNTRRVLQDNLAGSKTEKSFLNLLPNATISYEIDKNHEISLKYFSYVNQPRLSYLNAFNTSTDLQRISIGNPELLPQKTHTLELAYMKEFKGGILTSSAYANITTGLIQVISTLDQANNIIISRPENTGRAVTYGLDVSYNINSPKWLSTIIKLDGQYGTRANSNVRDDEFYALNAAVVNVVRAGTYNLEMSWFYNAPKKVNYQLREEGNQYFKAGVGKRMFKNNGNLVLSVTDPFNTGRRVQSINGTDYYYKNDYNPNQRRVLLSLFLRFSAKSKFRQTEKEIKDKGMLE